MASFLFSALGSTFFAKKHGLWGFYFWSFSSTTVAGHDSTIFGDFRWSFWGHETYAASTETLGIRIEALRLPYVGVLPRIPGTEEITIDILLVQKLLRDHHWWWSNHTYRPCRVKNISDISYRILWNHIPTPFSCRSYVRCPEGNFTWTKLPSYQMDSQKGWQQVPSGYIWGCILKFLRPISGKYLSNEKKTVTFHSTGYLIAVLMMVYYNPYKLG